MPHYLTKETCDYYDYDDTRQTKNKIATTNIYLQNSMSNFEKVLHNNKVRIASKKPKLNKKPFNSIK